MRCRSTSLSHEFFYDWGFVSVLPLLGTLPDEFTEYETILPPITATQRSMKAALGQGTAARPVLRRARGGPAQGRARQPNPPPPPRVFGGNMDNKELKPGTTLYLPVFNEGALFSAGDGHGVQGDGEVCITALETGALTGHLPPHRAQGPGLTPTRSPRTRPT